MTLSQHILPTQPFYYTSFNKCGFLRICFFYFTRHYFSTHFLRFYTEFFHTFVIFAPIMIKIFLEQRFACLHEVLTIKCKKTADLVVLDI